MINPIPAIERSRFDFLWSKMKRALLASLIKSRQQPAPILYIDPTDHIGQVIAAEGLYERYYLEALIAWMRASGRTMDVALDVGANIGNHTIYLARFFRRVLAFEPLPAASHALQASLVANDVANVSLFPVALSRERSSSMLYVARNGNLGESSLCIPRFGDSFRRIPVEVWDGDSLVSESLSSNSVVSLVKLDVEGSEVDALTGLTSTIKQFRPVIVFEVNTKRDGEAVSGMLQELRYADFFDLSPGYQQKESKVAKTISILIEGLRYRFKRITHFEDRHYSMIVADPGQ